MSFPAPSGPPRARVYAGLLLGVVAVSWAAPLLNEKPDWVQLVGGGMALVGVALMAREEAARQPPPPDMVPAAD